MAIYNIVCEGQTISVPEEIGKFDDKVKQALAPFYPEVANALITRAEKDGVVTVSVVKKAGSKGTGAQSLIDCQGGKNPAIALYEEIQDLRGQHVGPYELITLDARLADAIEEGQEQANQVAYAAKRLTAARATPASVLVVGF